VNLTQRLQTELNGVAMMLQTLQSGCDAVVGNGNCNAIPTGDYTVTVDYTGVRNLAFCYSLNESGL